MKTSIELPGRLTVTSDAPHAHQARVVWLLAYTVFFLVSDLTWMAWLLPESAGDSTRLPWSRMVLLASLAGSAGGTLHGLASLSVHVGRRTFDRQWSLFYVVRPFQQRQESTAQWAVGRLGPSAGRGNRKTTLARLDLSNRTAGAVRTGVQQKFCA